MEKNGVGNNYHCIRLLNWFLFRDHMCLVFKKYGLSLYEFLKKNKYRPLPLSQIQHISKQLLTAIYCKLESLLLLLIIIIRSLVVSFYDYNNNNNNNNSNNNNNNSNSYHHYYNHNHHYYHHRGIV